MKKHIVYILLSCITLVSCSLYELDNQEPPKSEVYGNLVYNGQVVPVKNGQIPLNFYQDSYKGNGNFQVMPSQDGKINALLFDGEYKIILEPKRNLKEDWIEYDQVKWKMEDGIKDLVDNLLKEKSMSIEDKILEVYKYICLNYIYDVNVLYFFRKDKSDINNVKYIAVDWYGRIIGEDWKEKRKNHNRRICYEFARFYAKAINTLIDGNNELEAFMLGLKDNTHYVVGLTGKEYSVVLDLDDFNSIKDLTRVKLGLTIKGIKILRDETGKFQKAVNDFNKDKKEELEEVEEAKKNIKSENLIEYFKYVIQVLNKYNIDAQGIFEYMRAVVETEEIEIEKIWKEDQKAPERRYERCIYFKYEGNTYLIDTIEKSLKNISKKDLDPKIFIENPEENQYKYYGG